MEEDKLQALRKLAEEKKVIKENIESGKYSNLPRKDVDLDKLDEYVKMHEDKKQFSIDVKNGKFNNLPKKDSKFGK